MSERAKIRPVRLDISAADWARETASFSELLKRRPSKPVITRWMNESQVRQDLFGLTVLGVIRWPKDLGRPATPTLAEGFVAQHRWWFDEWHFSPDGGIIETEGWAKGDPPTLWDATEEPDFYRVHYMLPERPNPNWIEIRFSGVRWKDSGSRHLPWSWSLSPRGFVFTGKGSLTLLPPITVQRTLLLKS